MADPAGGARERLDDVAGRHVPDVRAVVGAADDPLAVAGERQAVDPSCRQVVGEGPGLPVRRSSSATAELGSPANGLLRASASARRPGRARAARRSGSGARSVPPARPTPASRPGAAEVIRAPSGGSRRAPPTALAAGGERALPDRPPAAGVEQQQPLGGDRSGRCRTSPARRRGDGRRARRRAERLDVELRDRARATTRSRRARRVATSTRCSSERLPLPRADRERPPVRRELHRLLRDGRGRAAPSRPTGFQVRRSVKRTTPVVVPAREQPPVGAGRDGRTLDRRQPQRADRRRVALQHREQVAAGLRRGPRARRRRRRAASTARASARVSASAPTRSASDVSACASAAALRPRVVALSEASAPPATATTSRTRGAREQPAQPAVRPPLARAARARPRRRSASRKARSVALSSARRPRQLDRGREPGAAVEVGRLAAAGLPQPRGVAELPVQRGCPRGPRRASGAAAATRGSAPRARPRRCRRRA